MSSRALIHIIGFHNSIRCPKHLQKILPFVATDMQRILVTKLGKSTVVTKSIMGVQTALKLKEHECIVYTVPPSHVQKEGPLFPLYNFGPGQKLPGQYKNLYFYVPAIGISNQLEKSFCDGWLEQLKVTRIPEYPLAGTELQKELLLDLYVNGKQH